MGDRVSTLRVREDGKKIGYRSGSSEYHPPKTKPYQRRVARRNMKKTLFEPVDLTVYGSTPVNVDQDLVPVHMLCFCMERVGHTLVGKAYYPDRVEKVLKM